MDFFSTPLLVTVILGAVGLAIPIIDALKKERGANNSLYCGISVGAIILVIGIIIFRILFGESIPTIEFGKSMLADDMFGSFFAITLLIVSVMVTASSWNYMKNKTNPAAYYSLILLSSIGMILIAYSTDLVMLLVAWELMSIPTYALAAFSKRDPISNEAAIKYFLFGALSSAILVLAIGLVYGVTGTTNIGEAIVSMVNVQKDLVPVTLLAVALFIAGFGFKMGLVPFHMWLPDAYEGAPTTIGALLAAGTKKAGFAAAIRVIVLATFALHLDWATALAVIAVFTMTLGNLGALVQKSVPRILAYSSIAQAGYIMIGLALAPYSDQALGGSLFHILNHAVMKSAAFIAAAAVSITLASYSIEKYRGLAKRMPITAIALSISLLALAGVPPLNGFWSKLVLFNAGIVTGPEIWWGPYLAIAGVLNSALSLGYYAWIMRKMYMEESPDTTKVKEPRAMLAVLIFSMIFMVGFGIWHAPILDFATNSVPNLSQLTAVLPSFPTR
ncbi:MAG: NADH-quinone oxidoreductase subunit N [Nitrososphaeraceae archaeon]|nr:NADH-quinone oxidoreductase subunit N [Nitrososphaeraceae archaeon]MDW0178477.1 NADH-quinone oxidoreductase subunit N [Nitrososphaeraceae archaeon]MDW0183456.1 NADH-quinone oxidoreductase subunit N [Nitrososphaeraceae archaeon]MDW0185678.1 NADH-quinone oxidoreductase subunit N [Nitrososphaeraceae archaeon]MDW0220666.1 NADH-quinone oxidoreductase subunit N [Nitrososphaeraceae archaeon]